MPYGTVNADVIGTSVANSNLGAGNATRFKNRIINGNMAIAQRGTTFTGVSNLDYTLDRWQASVSTASKMSVTQNAGSVTPPAGFTNYMGLTVASAVTSLAAGDYYLLQQKIEGLNVADLGWGTANAKSVTLSFWVYSNLTGTFGGAINNSAQTRSYVFSYTISTANTWQQITVTIPGDTSGTWLTTNGIGLWLNWSIGTGSTYSGTAGVWGSTLYNTVTGNTNVMASTANYWYMTGAQIEVGSIATGFEYVDYGTQLAMCLRYYEVATSIDLSGYVQAGKQAYSGYTIYPKRTSATIAIASVSNTDNCNGISITGNDGIHVNFQLIGNNGGLNYVRVTGNTVTFSAEL